MTSALFLVRFNISVLTMGFFYWSYMLLLKSPILKCSWDHHMTSSYTLLWSLSMQSVACSSVGNNPPISEVIETGCIPKFIELLSHSDPQLQVHCTSHFCVYTHHKKEKWWLIHTTSTKTLLQPATTNTHLSLSKSFCYCKVYLMILPTNYKWSKSDGNCARAATIYRMSLCHDIK